MAVLQAIFRAFLNIAMIAMFLTSPAQAGTKSWQISESSGEVSVETGNSSSSASRGMLLQAGDAVATGASGRAVIVRGGEYVIVSPKSRVRITKPSETGAVVQIFQSVGSALFKIRKMETPHFGVKTPYLAAVVKGTTFNVTVTENGATVQVTEGRVEVSTLDGGASDMIVPGRIGRVDGNDKQLLKVLGTDEKSIRSTLPTTNSGSGKIEEKATTSGDTDSSSTKQTSDSDIGTQKGNASDASSDGAGLSNGATGSGFSGWISSAINSEPISLAVATAGLISGSQAIDSIAARAGSSAYSGGNSDNAGNANGNAGGNSGNAGNANGNAGGNSGNAGNGSGNAGGNS
ncbi:MAG: FecR family protein, partial [Sphingorhabdus sp.]